MTEVVKGKGDVRSRLSRLAASTFEEGSHRLTKAVLVILIGMPRPHQVENRAKRDIHRRPEGAVGKFHDSVTHKGSVGTRLGGSKLR